MPKISKVYLNVDVASAASVESVPEYVAPLSQPVLAPFSPHRTFVCSSYSQLFGQYASF